MNASSGRLIGYRVFGTSGRFGGTSDQWRVQFAPSSTHRFSTATFSGVRGLLNFAGGIRWPASVVVIRSIRSLSPGLPAHHHFVNAVLGVETELRLTGLHVRAVASEAVVRQDRHHLPAEIHRGRLTHRRRAGFRGRHVHDTQGNGEGIMIRDD